MKTGLLGHFGYSLEYLSDFKELCQFFSFFWAENLYTTFPSLPSKSHAIQIILLKKKRSTDQLCWNNLPMSQI